MELEAGPVWQTRNDIQVPNDAMGTRFSLVDAIGRGPWPAGRLYATWSLAENHAIRLLLAPLVISGVTYAAADAPTPPTTSAQTAPAPPPVTLAHHQP